MLFHVQRLSRAVRRHGPRATVRMAAEMATQRGRSFLRGHYMDAWLRAASWVDLWVDRRFGTDTAGTVRLDDLTFASANKSHGTKSQPMQYVLWRRLARHFPRDLDRYTFIDFGAGKGRVILYASALPFRRIIGVEFSPELANICASNIAIYRARTGDERLSIENCDAAEFALPDGPLLLFFANPFTRAVSEGVAAKIAATLAAAPREVYLVWHVIGDGTLPFYRIGLAPIAGHCEATIPPGVEPWNPFNSYPHVGRPSFVVFRSRL